MKLVGKTIPLGGTPAWTMVIFAAADVPLGTEVFVKDNTVVNHEMLMRFERAVGTLANMHSKYQGKAMTDEVYERFATLRDEAIPTMRRELISALLKGEAA